MAPLPPEYPTTRRTGSPPPTRWYETPLVVFLGLGVGTALAWTSVTVVCALIDWGLSG